LAAPANGVVVKGGDDNLIEIAKGGTITSKSRHAILGGEEDETVENSGLVWGDVDLDGGFNAFNNNQGGKFYSGDVIYLGAGNLLTNEGNLSPGGPWSLETSVLTGDLLQTPAGKYTVDVNMGKATSDRIDIVEGGWADLAGKVSPLISNPVTGKEKVTILTAEGGVIDNGIKVKDTAVADFALHVNPNDVELKVDVDFAPKGLDKDEVGWSAPEQGLCMAARSGLWPVTHALLELESQRSAMPTAAEWRGLRDPSVSSSLRERFSRQMNCPAGDRGCGAAVVARCR
jgi:hypothetical protein